MNKRSILLLAIAILGFVVLNSTTFIVNETEQAIVTQFGKPVGPPITTPGIHFKVPLIQDTHFFDKRFLGWDGDPNQIPTKDKRFIWVDNYARWRIIDPLRFFQRVRDERGAQTRLDDILDGETRNAIANHDLVEIVRSTNRELDVSEDLELGAEEAESSYTIKFGREKITRLIIEASSPRLRELGIELLDLRLKRINYVDEVQQKIFE